MLAIDIGPMFDRGLDNNNCGLVILAPKSLPTIGPESLPMLSRMILQIYNDINDNNI